MFLAQVNTSYCHRGATIYHDNVISNDNLILFTYEVMTKLKKDKMEAVIFYLWSNPKRFSMRFTE